MSFIQNSTLYKLLINNFFFIPFVVLCIAFSSKYGLASSKDLEKVLDKYWKSNKVTLNVKKSLEQQLSVSKDKTSEGKLYYSKGNLRIIFEKPKFYEIVIDNENIWLSQKARSFGEESWRVSKFSKKKIMKRSQTLLGLLFADKNIIKNFAFAEQFEKNGLKSYVLRPLKKKQYPNVDKLAIVINKNFEIELLRQWDNLGNIVSYRFSDQNFSAKFEDSLLIFKMPQNAELNVF